MEEQKQEHDGHILEVYMAAGALTGAGIIRKNRYVSSMTTAITDDAYHDDVSINQGFRRGGDGRCLYRYLDMELIREFTQVRRTSTSSSISWHLMLQIATQDELGSYMPIYYNIGYHITIAAAE